MSPIRLLYIEDHPVVIRGLRDIFRSTRDEIALTASGEDIGEVISTVSPEDIDLIMLDLFLGKDDPLENIRRLTKCFPGKPIIIYTGYTGGRLMREAFELGIKGWMSKSLSKSQIKQIIKAVAKGEIIYPQELLARQAGSENQTQNRPDATKTFYPTKEQLDIMSWLCEGNSTQEIADKHLKLTLSTVEKKIQVMRELTEVKTNCELVRFYLNHYRNSHEI